MVSVNKLSNKQKECSELRINIRGIFKNPVQHLRRKFLTKIVNSR